MMATPRRRTGLFRVRKLASAFLSLPHSSGRWRYKQQHILLGMVSAVVLAVTPLNSAGLAHQPAISHSNSSWVHGALGAAAYSPDGRWLAIGGYRQVWLLEVGREGFRKGLASTASLGSAAGPVTCIAFSPDGRLLAAAGGAPGEFGEIRLWDVRSRQLLRTLRGHRDAMYGVAFSPDGRTLAAGSYDWLVSLWSVQGGPPRMLKDHIDAVYAVAFSPDGRQVASAAGDRTIKVWDVATGKRAYTLSEPNAEQYAVAFSPDGHRLAAAGADRMLRLWNVSGTGGTLARSAFAHEAAVLRLAFSPDGERLVSSGEDRWVKVWNTATLTEERVLERQPDWASAIAVRPDGQAFAVGRHDGTLALYDPATGKRVGTPVRPAARQTTPPAPRAATPRSVSRGGNP
jgi:WD40 repeat protein